MLDIKVSQYIDEKSLYVVRSLINKQLFSKYKNSKLGIVWHFLMPLLMLSVYYFAFEQFNRYSITNMWFYLSSGIFIFNFMLNSLVSGSSCITSSSDLIKKSYFLRELIPFSFVATNLIIMIIGYVIVIALALIVGISFNPALLLLFIVVVFLCFIFSLGLTLLFSALSVYVRDIQYVLNGLSMAFFFATPLYFTVDSLAGFSNSIVWLNPFSYFVEAAHNCLYYGCFYLDNFLMCLILSVVSIVLGTYVFSRLKKGFSERM